MAQIVYRNRHGADVCVKNPTPADMAAFREDWKAQNGERVWRVFMLELRRRGSIFADPETFLKQGCNDAQ